MSIIAVFDFLMHITGVVIKKKNLAHCHKSEPFAHERIEKQSIEN